MKNPSNFDKLMFHINMALGVAFIVGGYFLLGTAYEGDAWKGLILGMFFMGLGMARIDPSDDYSE